MTIATGAAAVRASVPRDQIEYARKALGDRFAPLEMDAAFAAALDRLETTPRLGWFAVADFDTLTIAIHRVLGDEGYRAITYTTTLTQVRGDVLAGMATTFRALFGVGPGTLLRAYPTALSVLYRNFGRAEILMDSDDATLATLRLSDVPPAHLHRGSLEGIAGSLEALVHLMGHKATVTIRGEEAPRGSASFDCRW